MIINVILLVGREGVNWMKRKLHQALLLCMVLLLLTPNGAFAYTYGDPTKEDVAETFKIIVSKLNGPNPDWNGAHEAYKVRRTEISSHFGASIATTLDKNFEKKEKELVLENYKAVLVLNLKRRFDYAAKDINDDYNKAKLLLAKAKGTFDVLRPYVEAKKPSEVSKIYTAFDKALEALGNPGLFGVGEKPTQPEEYKKNVDYIYKTLKPLFTFTEYKESSTQKEEAKPAVPTKTTKKETTSTTTGASKPVASKQETVHTESQESKVKNGETVTKKEEVEQENKAQEENQAENANQETEGKQEGDSTTATAQGNESDSAKEESATQSSQTEEASETVVKAEEEHAPMERTKKTNPLVSVLIIGGVILVGGGAIWMAKKKGFI